MAGVAGRSGRKPKQVTQELRDLMNGAWPDRAATVERHVRAANQGDAASFRVLMAYAYGTPPSGDETKVRQEVTKQFDDIVQRLETIVRERFSQEDAEWIIHRLFASEPS